MTMFKLSISLADDALVSHLLPELANILNDAARKVSAGIVRSPLRDSNGNTVGSFEVTKQ